jgi:hypothetical protein
VVGLSFKASVPRRPELDIEELEFSRCCIESLQTQGSNRIFDAEGFSESVMVGVDMFKLWDCIRQFHNVVD